MKKFWLLFVLSMMAQSNILAEQEFKDLEFLAMEKFSVEKKYGKVYVGFDYVIKNPNWYSIIIKPSSLFLKIADSDCGWVKVEEKTKVKAKETQGYHFVLVGDASMFVKSTFSSIWSMMKGKGIDFTISGKLKAGVVFFKMKFQVDYTYKMTFDEFMSFF